MYGQLGHGSTEKQSAPKLVAALEGSIVYLLACGNFHTVSTVYNYVRESVHRNDVYSGKQTSFSTSSFSLV